MVGSNKSTDFTNWFDKIKAGRYKNLNSGEIND